MTEPSRTAGARFASRGADVVLVTLAVALLVVVLGLRHTVGPSVVKRATTRVGVEVFAFGAALFLVFAFVGLLSMDAGLVDEWTGGQAAVLVTLGLGRPQMVVTAPLLQVAAFLGSLGALAFAVEVVTDPDTRHLLVGDLVGSGELVV